MSNIPVYKGSICVGIWLCFNCQYIWKTWCPFVISVRYLDYADHRTESTVWSGGQRMLFCKHTRRHDMIVFHHSRLRSFCIHASNKALDCLLSSFKSPLLIFIHDHITVTAWCLFVLPEKYAEFDYYWFVPLWVRISMHANYLFSTRIWGRCPPFTYLLIMYVISIR